MIIEIQEVIAGIEACNLGRLTACWLTVAAVRAKGDWNATVAEATALGVPVAAITAMEAYFASIPENQRGFIKE